MALCVNTHLIMQIQIAKAANSSVPNIRPPIRKTVVVSTHSSVSQASESDWCLIMSICKKMMSGKPGVV